MIGLILLILSLLLIQKDSYKHFAIVLYVGFLLNGYNIYIDSVVGFKNIDSAIIFTLFFLAKNKRNVKQLICSDLLAKFVLGFCVFITCSMLFSWLYYKIPFETTFRASRAYFLVCSYFVFRLLPLKIHIKVFRVLLIITAITSIIYILQLIFGRPLLPYDYEFEFDRSTGLIRLYNSPSFLYFFLVLSMTDESMIIRRNKNKYRCLFFISLICTLGRTQIIVGILSILLTMALRNNAARLFKTAIVIILLFLPFINIVANRFNEGGTDDDLTAIKNGGYEDASAGWSGGTMFYRIAWVYERYDYISERPVTEQLFGLGMVGNSEPWVYKKYNFTLGIKNDKDQVFQLDTPDIMYGDILCHLGYLGSAIYLYLIIFIIVLFWKNRKNMLFSQIGFSLLLLAILNSMSGSILAYPKSLSIYFILLALVYAERKSVYSNCNI